MTQTMRRNTQESSETRLQNTNTGRRKQHSSLSCRSSCSKIQLCKRTSSDNNQFHALHPLFPLKGLCHCTDLLSFSFKQKQLDAVAVNVRLNYALKLMFEPSDRLFVELVMSHDDYCIHMSV